MRGGCSRRTFLQVSGYTGVCHLVLGGLAARLGLASEGTPEGGLPEPAGRGRVAFRRSGKGRHVSNAARQHNANHLYATQAAAAADPAHPGDRSKVVPVVISAERHDALFGQGQLNADLRHRNGHTPAGPRRRRRPARGRHR